MSMGNDVDIIFDFDYTLVDHESTVEVLKAALHDHPDSAERLERIARIAPKALSGKASIGELLKLMSVATHVRAHHIDQYVEKAIRSIPAVLLETLGRLREDGVGLHIISGGYTEWIVPTAREWGIAHQNVAANQFLWAGKRVLLTRPSPLLSSSKGKSEIVRRWRAAGRLKGRTLIVGDGASDLQVYKNGCVDGFVCADYFIEQPLTQLPDNVLRASEPAQVYAHIQTVLGNLQRPPTCSR